MVLLNSFLALRSQLHNEFLFHGWFTSLILGQTDSFEAPKLISEIQTFVMFRETVKQIEVYEFLMLTLNMYFLL